MHDGSISELFEVTVNAEALDLQATKSSSRKSTPKKKYIPVPLESRQRSAAWHYFIKAEVVGTSQCNVCKEVVKHANNTSNLLKHLQTKHPDQYRQAKRLRKEDEKASKKVKKSKPDSERKKTIKKVSQDKPKTSWTITRSESIDQALVRMIATDMQPASIVDDPGFQALVRLLDSRYQLPSKKHIMTGLLPDMYSKRAVEIKEELTQIPHVALTSEVWSFRTTERYLTINCQFLTSSWELKSVGLETFGYKSEYTAESIAATFQRVAAEWGISQKIAAMVTDDAANVVAAVRLTGWMQVPCFAYTLNQVVSEAIIADARINELRKNCREVVSFFHGSIEAAEKLKEIQLQVGVPEHKLIQEVETRWTSTYHMFERIIEQCQAITTALCLCSRSDLCLSSYHVSLLEASVRVLKPFEATTKELSADKYAISKVIPLAKSLQRLTDAIASDDTPLVSGLRAQMQMRFTSIESSHILAMSALVDPRMKKMAFRDSGALQQGEQLIIQEMSKLAPASSGEDVPTTEAPQDSGLWDLFDTTVRESHSPETGTNNVTLEARKFFEQPVLPRHEDPLIWWRANERYYELLGKVAKKYLCIPGTSVPAERLFSKAGELISMRRDRLKPKHVNMFLFLNKNL